jgi:hypothetical protein
LWPPHWADQARSFRRSFVAGYSANRFQHLRSWRLSQARFWSGFKTRRSLSFNSYGLREMVGNGELQWQIYLPAWANSCARHRRTDALLGGD